jgi:hypothetical protein
MKQCVTTVEAKDALLMEIPVSRARRLIHNSMPALTTVFPPLHAHRRVGASNPVIHRAAELR